MAKHRPTLRAGQKGRAVRALQLGLRKALPRSYQNKANGVYGSGTIRDVARFKAVSHIYADGTLFASTAWKKLEQYLTPAAKALLLPPPRKVTPAAQRRAKIAQEGYWVLAHAWYFRYGQRRPYPRPPNMRNLRYARGYYDCSSSSVALYYMAGAPDPNRSGFGGSGNTWSMMAKGHWTRNPQPGDLAFYGRGGNPTHMAVVLGGGYVFSFGSTPPRRRALRYRSDFIGTKSVL